MTKVVPICDLIILGRVLVKAWLVCLPGQNQSECAPQRIPVVAYKRGPS